MNEKDEILNGSDETPVIETKEQESTMICGRSE